MKSGKPATRCKLTQAGVGHVLMPRTMDNTIGDQLRWMRSTRYSRPLGHIGTGLTYAVPFGLLGLVAGIGAGHPALGVAFLATALLNRILQCVIVGGGILRDKRALEFCWLYPLRDLLGFLTWAGSFTSREFQLARRNLSLRARRKDQSPAPAGRECGSRTVTGTLDVAFNSARLLSITCLTISCRRYFGR